MCGFAAMLAFNGQQADLNVVGRMTAVIAHRGPDDQGTYLNGPVGLGFRRLSIMDLSAAGHQPMASEDGQIIIVFNGEIYNFTELRQELEALGHRFHSHGDTEVLLKAYTEWGENCLRKLNGMWAFLVYDWRAGKLFGSRDRFGIKPLYRFTDQNQVLFGSEIKAILASGVYQRETNWAVASNFLVKGQLDQTHETFYAGIEQVPPGTAFEIYLDGSRREWSYWSANSIPEQKITDPATEFAALFEDAVNLHMRSDVPVGVNLSGGLDSTSILCSSARIREKAGAQTPLLAFSYMDRDFDESEYIADTIEQTGASLIKLATSPGQLWSKLSDVLWFQDEPVHTLTAVVGYELMGLVASHQVKVVLNGQGADETIAGYPSYFKDYWSSLLMQGQFCLAWSEISQYSQYYAGSPWKLYLDRMRHNAQNYLGNMAAYKLAKKIKKRKELLGNPWFSSDLLNQVPDDAQANAPCGLDASLVRSMYQDPLPLYLRIEDRNSMAHSVEARLPFLDYRLVEFEFNLPLDWKMRGHWNKYILRESMRGRIPESVRSRVDKMGFPVPSQKWFSDALYEPVMDILSGNQARERGIYNIPNIIKDMELHRQGKIRMHDTLFKISQFELWNHNKNGIPLSRTRSDLGTIKLI